MLVRWSRFCYNVDKFLSFLDVLIPDFYIYRKDRPPKHTPREYLRLIILKEYLRASLRDADSSISIFTSLDIGLRGPSYIIR